MADAIMHHPSKCISPWSNALTGWLRIRSRLIFCLKEIKSDVKIDDGVPRSQFLMFTSILNFPSKLPLVDPVYIVCILISIILITPWIAVRLRIPPLVVLIGLGMLTGANGLGIVARDDQLKLLEKFGLLYIMLIAGLQMDLSNIRRLGVRSLLFGLLTFGIPFSLGVAYGQFMQYGILTALLVGILYSPHTLVSYPIVTQKGIAQAESVGVAVGGTVVTSILTLTSLSILQSVHSGSVGIELAIRLVVLLPLLVWFCFWGIPKVGQSILQKDSSNTLTQFIFVLACLFGVASATLLLNIDSIVGAFIAGLALNRLVPFASPLMKQIEFVGNSFFIPCFLISVGVLANPRIFLTHPENLGLTLAIVMGAVGAKVLAAGLAGWKFQYSFSEIMLMSSLTLSRAALVLVIALFGKEAGLLSEGIFNAIIAYIVCTCLIGPLLTNRFAQEVSQKLVFDQSAELQGAYRQ
jgi:Kef-type K+ transport system membrane component KefB